MINDDQKDEIMRRAAESYNRPPATPRDEMWTAIQAARAAADASPRLHISAGGAASGSGYSAKSRFGTRYTWMGLAAAAALLIATGVGIGRWTSRPSSGSSVAIANPAIVESPSTVAEVPTPSASGAEPAQNSETSPAASSREENGEGSTNAKPRTREEIRKSPRIIGHGGTLFASQNDSHQTSPIGSPAVAYQVATQKHLEDAEALLTSFSLEGHDAKMDTQFAGWAKGLLSNTRLLLDSPAGDDPRRAKLLQDLELVLAQIVQLSPNAPAQDRELIQGSIQNGHVMTRLRSAIPADQR